jgi:hypothetical protein
VANAAEYCVNERSMRRFHLMIILIFGRKTIKLSFVDVGAVIFLLGGLVFFLMNDSLNRMTTSAKAQCAGARPIDVSPEVKSYIDAKLGISKPQVHEESIPYKELNAKIARLLVKAKGLEESARVQKAIEWRLAKFNRFLRRDLQEKFVRRERLRATEAVKFKALVVNACVPPERKTESSQ